MLVGDALSEILIPWWAERYPSASVRWVLDMDGSIIVRVTTPRGTSDLILDPAWIREARSSERSFKAKMREIDARLYALIETPVPTPEIPVHPRRSREYFDAEA